MVSQIFKQFSQEFPPRFVQFRSAQFFSAGFSCTGFSSNTTCLNNWFRPNPWSQQENFSILLGLYKSSPSPVYTDLTSCKQLTIQGCSCVYLSRPGWWNGEPGGLLLPQSPIYPARLLTSPELGRPVNIPNCMYTHPHPSSLHQYPRELSNQRGIQSKT